MRPLCMALVVASAFATGGCHLIAGYDAFDLRELAEPSYARHLSGAGSQSIDALEASSGALVAGSYRPDLDIAGVTLPLADDGVTEAFVARFDDRGQLLGSVTLGAGQRAVPSAISGDTVVGLFEGSLSPPDLEPLTLEEDQPQGIFALRVDDTGKIQEARAYSGSGFSFSKLDVVRDGEDTVLAGGFLGALDVDGCEMSTSAGVSSVFLVKSGASGCDWYLSNEEAPSEKAIAAIEAVDIDLAKNIVVAGEFGDTLRFDARKPDGTPLYPPFDLEPAGGAIDFFVARFEPDGKLVYARSFGDPAGLQASARIDAHLFGNVVFAGYFDGTVDFGTGPLTSRDGHDVIIVKLDPDGNTLWARHFNVKRAPCDVEDCDIDRLDVAFDRQGNVVLAGQLGGTIDFGGTIHKSSGPNDIYLVKLDRDGELLWSGRYGDAAAQCQPPCHLHLGIDDSNNVLLGGPFTGTVAFDDVATLTAVGDPDAFLAKFAP